MYFFLIYPVTVVFLIFLPFVSLVNLPKMYCKCIHERMPVHEENFVAKLIELRAHSMSLNLLKPAGYVMHQQV